MRIKQITFNRHVNTGNYESFEVQATADVGSAELPGVLGTGLMAFIDELCQQRIDSLRRPGRRGGMDAGEVLELGDD